MISIIVPIFNSQEYLSRCIQSVISQSYIDFELILVDDGSTDSSFSICSKYAALDLRVRAFSQNNSGASIARNKGLSEANGDWMMFLDSDDWIDRDMLETMVEITEKYSKVEVIQSRVPRDMVQRSGDAVYDRYSSVKALLEGSWWGPYCKLIKKDAIAGLRFPNHTISEDYLFNYQLFSNISCLYYIDKCFYHRQVRPGSLSRISLSERKFDEFYNVKAVSDAVAQDFPDYLQLADNHLAGTCLKLLFLVFNNNAEKKYSRHLDYILREIRKKYFSFIFNPFIPRNERILLCGCGSKMSSWFIHRIYRYVKSDK